MVTIKTDKEGRCKQTLTYEKAIEIFEMLLEDYRGYEETRLTKGRRELTVEDTWKIDTLCLTYRKKREMKKTK